MKFTRFIMGTLCLVASATAFLPPTLVSKTTPHHARLMSTPTPIEPDDDERLEALRANLEKDIQLLVGGVKPGIDIKRHRRRQLNVADNFVSLMRRLEAPTTTEKPVKITFSKGSDQQIEESFDLLIIASNPNELGDSGVLQLTPHEQEVYDNFKNAVFQTTLLKVDPAKRLMNSVRFNPNALSDEAGHLYGYRSETRKSFQKLPLDAKKELVTTYQLLNPNTQGELDTTQLFDLLEKEMKLQEAKPQDEAWFPYKYSTAEVIGKPFYTKYFNRFDLSGLRNELPWKLIDLQGEKNTINLHGSCCFESVLHIYQYIDLLAKERPEIFPSDRKNTKIGIVGGGPSGLLAARKLGEMGYDESNIVIFEKKENDMNPTGNKLAGKTQTRTQIQLGKQIPAELGTCYLSPAYNEMVKDLSDIMVDNKRIAFDQTDYPFRAIVTEGMFKKDGPVMTLWNAGNKQLREDIGAHGSEFPSSIDYDVYTKVKGFEETGTVSGSDPIPRLEKQYARIELLMGLKVIEYCVYHRKTFGAERPMPFECPDELKEESDIGGMTIGEFLEQKDFKVLIGTLQYAYSVQGYGSLEGQMPAWYLLTWITPQTMIPSLLNQLKGFLGLCKASGVFRLFGLLKQEAIVTALSKGWGDVWLQQKEQLKDQGVTIHYETKISSISRN